MPGGSKGGGPGLPGGLTALQAALLAQIAVDTGTTIPADILANFNRMGAPAGASMSADIAAINTLLGVPEDTDISTDIENMAKRVDFFGDFVGQEELDPDFWTEVLDGASTGAFTIIAGPGGGGYYILTTILGNEDAYFYSTYRYTVQPSNLGNINNSWSEFNLEFTYFMDTPGATINTFMIMGLSSSNDNRTNPTDGAFFTLFNDLVRCQTRDGGVNEITDTAVDPSGEHKYKIIAVDGAYEFYIDDALVATHAVTVPDGAMYVVFGRRADGNNVGTTEIQQNSVHIWGRRR